jgi:phage terminase large subunit-like protein
MPDKFIQDGLPLITWQGEDRLRRFRRFCRQYIVIPDGFGAGLPMELYPTQAEWVRSIIGGTVTVITVGKGNAKSSTMAAVAFWWGADPPPGDFNAEIIIVAGSKDQARAGVYQTCVDMVHLSPFVEGVDYWEYRDINDPRIEFRNGSTIRIRSSSPKRLHGIKPSLGCLDEIGLVSDEEVWNTLVQSTGKRPGARVVGIGTPGWERGALFELKVAHDAGMLPAFYAFHEHAAPPHYDVDDRRGWLMANPVRAAMDPEGWEHALEVIRNSPSLTAEDFRTFHLAQWPDLRGTPVVAADRWDELAGATDDIEGPFHVAIDGDWQRRNIAVVAALPRDGVTDLILLGVWEHQPEAVPAADILAAVTALGLPDTIKVGRSTMTADLADELHQLGAGIDELNTAQASVMRDPTDRLLAAIESGTIRHDGHSLFRAQVLAARQDVRKEGIVFMRDDRLEQRIDALVAGAVCHFDAVSGLIPAVH